MTNPIHPKIGATFIPVRNIQQARDWYCSILGLPATEEIINGHLYVIPLEDQHNIVLDNKIFSKRVVDEIPLFHFNTNDIEKAYQFMKEQHVNIMDQIEHGHYFTFKDPDDNVLMICKC
ncbi:VOC family protein [Jeotgalibacillus soli]|uniref:Glyoxalase n=1 Tax=Jeotgalibacillus soli TaxID=889306 RepID=A0A0C2W5W8_9BACL|nr:VOC family protein [Jeotgalibacillus soli]KIL51971.1 glyoxalase [Jeotgalibacillus soli]